jgi:hypothetical protein
MPACFPDPVAARPWLKNWQPLKQSDWLNTLRASDGKPGESAALEKGTDVRNRGETNMKWWKKIREAYRRFARGQPGVRFMRLHERWHIKSNGPAVPVMAVVVGIILIVAGAALGLVPGVPGVVLSLLGVGIIAAQIRVAARWCDAAEVALRGILQKWRAQRHNQNAKRTD